jgi:hypothetical protein
MAVLLYLLFLLSQIPLLHFGAVLNVGLAAAILLSGWVSYCAFRFRLTST